MSRTRPLSRRLARACLPGLFFLCGAARAVAPDALPEGPRTGPGGVTIGYDPQGMRIVQTQDPAVIDWRVFDIGPLVSVRVIQPSASATLLNRVTGATTSELAGDLLASGRVYLINPNGIHIASSGSVEAGAFVASTLDIANRDVAAGVLRFGSAARAAAGTITHAGRITIDPGGFAALLGERIEQRGHIATPLGQTALGAGARAVLAPGRATFLEVTLARETGAAGAAGAPDTAGARGTTRAAIVVSGTIDAPGGLVQVVAPRVPRPGRIPDDAVNVTGVVRARQLAGTPGTIQIRGDGGVVRLSCMLDASSNEPDVDLPFGGRVAVHGLQVMIGHAGINVSGAGGGGHAVLAATSRGAAGAGAPSGHAAHGPLVFVGAAAGISANATCRGAGGRIDVVSDGPVLFLGSHQARGAEPTAAR
ncbi:MAG: filamentous hemagglutinin N-terminal domain-containing protein [Janthinobacterium lividum]